MTLSLDEVLLDLSLLPHVLLLFNAQPVLLTRPTFALFQTSPKNDTKRKCEHTILRAVHYHDSILANLMSDLGEILGTLVVQPCGGRLEEEAALLEIFRMRALPQFVRGEAISIGGEGLDDVLRVVGRVEPLFSVEVSLHVRDLDIESFGDEEVGAGVEIFEEALE